MGTNRTPTAPALYAVDPDGLIDALFERMKAEGMVIVLQDAKWLTVQQAAKRLGFKPAYVRQLIESGTLKATDFAAEGARRRMWRIRVNDLGDK